jgi:putative selenium metabolism hydrolase
VLEISRPDRAALDSFLQDLVRIPSISGREEAVALRVEQELLKIGFDEVRVDQVGNVVGRIGPGTGHKLLYVSHMDTVGVGAETAWSLPPFAARVEDGVLHGRGVVDAKGPMASLVYGAKALLDSGLRLGGDLYLACVVHGETREEMAVRYLIEEEGLLPTWVLLAEPTDLQISRGQRGRMEIEVAVQGRPSHSASPEHGENAINGAARVIFALELLSASLAEDPLLGKGSMVVTGIDNAPSARNTVPERCMFSIDRRLTLGETEERALAEVEEVIAREGVRGSVSVPRYDVRSYTGYVSQGRGYYSAWLIEENHPLVNTLARTIQKQTGNRPRIGCWTHSTAGVYTMGQAGIPTLGFGPGQEQFCHTPDEQIRLKDCYLAAEIYAHFALNQLGQQAAL